MLSKWVQPFTPLRLFAAGEQGGWWDPSDFGTMFQDSAGTTPVTAVGQPVGLIRDKSGRGNHRTQATAASRPTLQQDASGYFYLLYDGVDDFMQTASIDLTGTNKATAWAGVTKTTDVNGVIYELSVASGSTDGTFALFAANANAANYLARLRGTVQANDKTLAGYAAPISNVISHAMDLAAGTVDTQSAVRINAQPVTAAASLSSVSAFTNQPLYFGRRAGTTLPFNGREYQTIIRGATSSAAQIVQTERFVGSRMGIVL